LDLPETKKIVFGESYTMKKFTLTYRHIVRN
jgi:hypothetical protein